MYQNKNEAPKQRKRKKIEKTTSPIILEGSKSLSESDDLKDLSQELVLDKKTLNRAIDEEDDISELEHKRGPHIAAEGENRVHPKEEIIDLAEPKTKISLPLTDLEMETKSNSKENALKDHANFEQYLRLMIAPARLRIMTYSQLLELQRELLSAVVVINHQLTTLSPNMPSSVLI